MKKIALTLTALFTALQFSYAQWSPSGTHIYNSNTGNVGIGTTTPSTLLQVNGTFSSTGDLSTFGNGTGDPHVDVIARGDKDGIRLFSLNNPSGGSVIPPSIGFYRFAAGATVLPRFRIKGSSPLWDIDGFQFSSPNSSITWMTGSTGWGADAGVRSNALNMLNLDQQTHVSQGTLVLGLDADAASAPTEGVLRSGQKNANNPNNITGSNLRIQAGRGTGTSAAGGNLYFETPDVSSTVGMLQTVSTKMVITRAGNVGIGTTTIPANYKLAVNGAAIATSMKVQVYSGWSDFVFRKDYKLPTLAEVKNYIDKNHHLPDMPSAAEVRANGLDLGEMNKQLLQKVEELTLYLINKDEQDKRKDAILQSQQFELEQQGNRIGVLEAALKLMTANAK